MKKVMINKVEEKFSDFFEKWICQLPDYVQQLKKETNRQPKTSTGGRELQALVSKVTQHFKEYYTMKWALAHEDVLAFFYPIWISPLETAYTWVTGWKPSVVFKLVDSLRKADRVTGQLSCLVELTEEQVRKIEELRLKMKSEEEKVEREMERQQVAVANTKMVELARLVFRVKNDEQVKKVEGFVQVALKGVMAGLEKVMKAADCVRLKTLKGILDVLNPLQCAEFLAATCMLHIQLRRWGKKNQYLLGR